jgi:hypothetical protein
MEQEPESPPLYITVKRVGYKLALAAHAVFIASALVGTVVLLAALVVNSIG